MIEDEVGHEHAPVHHVVRKLADALVLLHRAGRTGSVDLAAHRQWERVAEVELVTRELQKERWSLVPVQWSESLADFATGGTTLGLGLKVWAKF